MVWIAVDLVVRHVVPMELFPFIFGAGGCGRFSLPRAGISRVSNADDQDLVVGASKGMVKVGKKDEAEKTL